MRADERSELAAAVEKRGMRFSLTIMCAVAHFVRRCSNLLADDRAAGTRLAIGLVSSHQEVGMRRIVNRLQHSAFPSLKRQEGKLGWIFLWLIGVPIPVLLVLYLLRGCT